MLHRKRLYCFYFILLSNCTSAPERTAPNVYTVEIRQMQFSPAVLQVQKGDTVVFLNNDIVQHNVTEETNKSWSSSALSTGQSWKLAVTKNANYYCTIHPVMKGKLLVK